MKAGRGEPGKRRVPMAGYLARRPAQPARNTPSEPLRSGEVVALAATGIVAAALILLLASYHLALAVPIGFGYAALVWLLWRTRRR